MEEAWSLCVISSYHGVAYLPLSSSKGGMTLSWKEINILTNLGLGYISTKFKWI